jgi:chitin disaccharide deacetylase
MAATSIIVNADDLGIAECITEGIFAAWAVGAVGDTSAFANTKDLAALVGRAADEVLPVGVHLNLTHGRPSGDQADVPDLVGADGCFRGPEALPSPLPVAQVALEFRAQVAAFLDLGWWPSHLDGHHHVHLKPGAFEVTVALAKEFGLPVRAGNEAERDALRAEGIVTPDVFSGAFSDKHATLATLKAAVEDCPDGVLEMMTHPGHAAGKSRDWTTARAAELSILTSRDWGVFLAKKRIHIVGFNELQHIEEHDGK